MFTTLAAAAVELNLIDFGRKGIYNGCAAVWMINPFVEPGVESSKVILAVVVSTVTKNAVAIAGGVIV